MEKMEQLKQVLSAAQAAHVIGLMLVLFAVGHLVRPGDQFIGASAHDLLMAVLVAVRVGSDQNGNRP